MAFSFGDGFDLYAAPADAINGYWDSGTVAFTLATGRFPGSRALQHGSTVSTYLVKSSGQNDAVHHIVVAFQATLLGNPNIGLAINLVDGTTTQCTIVFRGDGAILLTSGASSGTVLATYAGAVPISAVWYAFEFEVTINNATGRFRVRKNGNPTDDFDSGAVLNTRGGTANNYANKLQVGCGLGSVNSQLFDDILWRSDASSVAWMGDIRCYTRMPASDSSVQFSKAPTSYVQTPLSFFLAQATAASQSIYTPIIAAYDGTVSTGTVTISAGFTGNLKCSVFNGTATSVTSIVASATTITNPSTGVAILTFPTPFTVTKGTQYWFGYAVDGSYGSAIGGGAGNTGRASVTTGYSTFPTASPVTGLNPGFICSWTIAVSTNKCLVNEAQEDGFTSYVYDSTVSHADFYGLGTLTATPATIIALTTRGYMEKSDTGARTASMQIKSGATTVATPTLTLTTGFQWAWRMDLTDPNTGSAWTATNANAVTFGPLVVS
jgi:hypothetical protein